MYGFASARTSGCTTSRKSDSNITPATPIMAARLVLCKPSSLLSGQRQLPYRRQLASWYGTELLGGHANVRLVPITKWLRIVTPSVPDSCQESRRTGCRSRVNEHEVYPGVHYRDNTEYRMYCAHGKGQIAQKSHRKASKEILVAANAHGRYARKDVEADREPRESLRCGMKQAYPPFVTGSLRLRACSTEGLICRPQPRVAQPGRRASAIRHRRRALQWEFSIAGWFTRYLDKADDLVYSSSKMRRRTRANRPGGDLWDRRRGEQG